MRKQGREGRLWPQVNEGRRDGGKESPAEAKEAGPGVGVCSSVEAIGRGKEEIREDWQRAEEVKAPGQGNQLKVSTREERRLPVM